MAANRKEIVQRINEAFAENNLEKVLSFCTDDFTWTMVGDTTVRGKDPIRKWMASMNPQPPQFTIQQTAAEGDVVITRGDMTMFVDDVLFARPKDFGFGGKDDTSGALYVPWLEPANQRRFKDDLRRTVARRLAGATVTGLDVADVTSEDEMSEGPTTLPSLALTDIDGKAIAAASLKGRPVVVEMWATWCPPCKSTMAWLNSLQKQYGDRAIIVAIAVDSTPEDVKKVVATLEPNYRIVMGTPDVIRAFGAVAAVPKLLIYDGHGTRTKVLYGAPPNLHQQIESAVKKASQSSPR